MSVIRNALIAELEDGLSDILASPRDGGELKAIVVRPGHGLRKELQSCNISLGGGVHGDLWATDCWLKTEEGQPHPDVQICMMNARCVTYLAGSRERWAQAGDNFFVDLDLSLENLPTGQRLEIGTAMIEITGEPHNACSAFRERYGRDAVMFVNASQRRAHRLRGIYARVVRDGRVSVGDRVTKAG